MTGKKCLLLRHLNLPRVDVVDDIMGRPAVDGAANALSGTQDLLGTASQIFCQGFELHGTGNVENFVKCDIARVLDVLLLLPVPWGLWDEQIKLGRKKWHAIGRHTPLRARMTREEAEGTMDTAACRFWIVSWTVTRRPFHAEVALAMSSPTFFGDWRTVNKSRTRRGGFSPDPEDRFWGRVQTRRQPHHRWHVGK